MPCVPCVLNWLCTPHITLSRCKGVPSEAAPIPLLLLTPQWSLLPGQRACQTRGDCSTRGSNSIKTRSHLKCSGWGHGQVCPASHWASRLWQGATVAVREQTAPATLVRTADPAQGRLVDTHKCSWHQPNQTNQALDNTESPHVVAVAAAVAVATDCVSHACVCCHPPTHRCCSRRMWSTCTSTARPSAAAYTAST